MTRRVEPLWEDREMSVVTLRPAASREVRVRAPDGSAVAGARVMGFGHASTVDEWPFSYAAATTDATGRARLRLPSEAGWTFEVVADGLAPARVERASGAVAEVDRRAAGPSERCSTRPGRRSRARGSRSRGRSG